MALKQILYHFPLQKSHVITIQKPMSTLGNYWQNSSPPYLDTPNSAPLAAPVLTWGSPSTQQCPSSAYLQESGAGGI